MGMNENFQNPLFMNNTLNLYGAMPAQGLNAANAGCGSCGGACNCASNTALSNPMQLQQTPMTQDVLQMNNGLGLSGMMGQGVGGADMGIAGSTLNLMAQISSMMATVMTGLMSFLTEIMSGSGASTGGNTSGLMASGGGGSLQDLVDQSANLPRNRAEESSNETNASEAEEEPHNHDHGDHSHTHDTDSADTQPIAEGRNADGSNVRATQTLEDYQERFGVSNLGIWGDEAHKKRKSDHNTGDALDLGVSSIDQGQSVADALVSEAQARGIKYIIFNHQIWSTERQGEGWRPYTGSNPHTTHVHTSFNA